MAALAVVLPIDTGVTGHSLRTLSAAATTTAALTIVDQILVPCRTGTGLDRLPFLLPFNGSVAPVAADRLASLRKSTLPLPSVALRKRGEVLGVGGGGASFLRAARPDLM
jgi:hypothetical protein